MPTVETRISRDQVLAEREYFANVDDVQSELIVAIGIPRRRDDGRYECIAEIVASDEIRHYPMNAPDRLGAISLAIEMLKMSVEIEQGRRERELIVKGREAGDGDF